VKPYVLRVHVEAEEYQGGPHPLVAFVGEQGYLRDSRTNQLVPIAPGDFIVRQGDHVGRTDPRTFGRLYSRAGEEDAALAILTGRAPDGRDVMHLALMVERHWTAQQRSQLIRWITTRWTAAEAAALKGAVHIRWNEGLIVGEADDPPAPTTEG
jgi:hypothetical protein